MFTTEPTKSIKINRVREKKIGVFLQRTPSLSTDRQWRYFIEWMRKNEKKVPWERVFNVYHTRPHLIENMRKFKYLWIYSLEVLGHDKYNRIEILKKIKKNGIKTFTMNTSYLPSKWVFLKQVKRKPDKILEIFDEEKEEMSSSD